MKMRTMLSRLTAFVAIAVFCQVMVSCTKEEENNEPKLPSKSEALATYDHNSGGIVKGVLTGSSGIFKFNLKNGSDSVYCLVTFDGQTGMLLPTTSMASWTPGQPFDATFSGTVGTSTVSVYFKCNADGTAPSATFTIPNHNVTVVVYKETSTVQVKGYEGTYINTSISTGQETDRGVFNFIECNGAVMGTHTSITYANDPRNVPMSFTGTVGNGKLTIPEDKLVFDITDTKVSGSVTSDDGTEKITITGERTL